MGRTITIPRAPKAVEKIKQVQSERRLNMQELQNLCGWDADAKFAQARARMKTPEGMSIGHHVVFSVDGTPQHLFMEMRKR